MSTVNELNAGVDAAKKTIRKVVDALAPNKEYPFFGNPHVKALEWLESREGREAMLEEVRQILAAAEGARKRDSAVEAGTKTP